MKIELTTKKEITETVEVELPIYRRHDLDSGTWFSKTGSDLKNTEVGVFQRRKGVEYGLVVKSLRSLNDFGNLDYCLGRGEYISDKEDFENALRGLQSAVNQELRSLEAVDRDSMDDGGPGEEDGPWAAGWEERAGILGKRGNSDEKPKASS